MKLPTGLLTPLWISRLTDPLQRLSFQSQPGGLPSDVLLHINMLDPANVLQQEAIGILGVNLILPFSLTLIRLGA